MSSYQRSQPGYSQLGGQNQGLGGYGQNNRQGLGQGLPAPASAHSPAHSRPGASNDPYSRSSPQSRGTPSPQRRNVAIPLENLDKVMLLTTAIGVIVNLAQIVAISNHSWVKATALYD